MSKKPAKAKGPKNVVDQPSVDAILKACGTTRNNTLGTWLYYLHGEVTFTATYKPQPPEWYCASATNCIHIATICMAYSLSYSEGIRTDVFNCLAGLQERLNPIASNKGEELNKALGLSAEEASEIMVERHMEGFQVLDERYNHRFIELGNLGYGHDAMFGIPKPLSPPGDWQMADLAAMAEARIKEFQATKGKAPTDEPRLSTVQVLQKYAISRTGLLRMRDDDKIKSAGKRGKSKNSTLLWLCSVLDNAGLPRK